MSEAIQIFQASEIIRGTDIHADLNIKIWKPSLFGFVPPGKGKKYVFYWLFHYLNIFKNNNYCAILIYNKSQLIASLLAVPAYYKWPFMREKDVQFTYVLTKKEFRGRGLALKMIQYAAKSLQNVTSYWYITESANLGSVRVAEKAGFRIVGTGRTVGFFRRIGIE